MKLRGSGCRGRRHLQSKDSQMAREWSPKIIQNDEKNEDLVVEYIKSDHFRFSRAYIFIFLTLFDFSFVWWFFSYDRKTCKMEKCQKNENVRSGSSKVMLFHACQFLYHSNYPCFHFSKKWDKNTQLVRLNRWNDTVLHHFVGCGEQNYCFFARCGFGAAASGRTTAGRLLHKNHNGWKNSNFAHRNQQNNVKGWYLNGKKTYFLLSWGMKSQIFPYTHVRLALFMQTSSISSIFDSHCSFLVHWWRMLLWQCSSPQQLTPHHGWTLQIIQIIIVVSFVQWINHRHWLY